MDFLLYVLIVLQLCFLQSLTQQSVPDVSGSNRKDMSDIVSSEANLDIRKLLIGTVENSYNPRTNQWWFIKNGNYSTAFEDFNSVHPYDVEEYKLPFGSKISFGKVGDRNIMVKKSSFGNAGQLKIFQEINGTPEYTIHYIDYIKYLTKQKGF